MSPRSTSLRRAIPARTTATRTGAAITAIALATTLAACSSSSTASSAASSPTATAGDPHTAQITITAADGCTSDKVAFPAGAVTFTIANKDATAVSEVELQSGQRIVGEKENLPPGFSGSFVVNVDAGSYTLYCPGAPKENTAITVTGKAAAAGDATVDALLAQGDSF